MDLRYLDMHQLGGNMYVISVLEDYSWAMLASVVSRTQNLTAYLMVWCCMRPLSNTEARRRLSATVAVVFVPSKL
ncbi:MAG: hypothetical protein NVSMB42_06640 [Herpetosiphon sp.]